jgi:uncharacterized protein (TIGR03435 family)
MTLPMYLGPLANHLWQSSLLVAAVWALSLLLRKERASLRYWLWAAASVKFLIPLAWLVKLGTALSATPMTAAPAAKIAFAASQVAQPFALLAPAPLLANVPEAHSVLPGILFGVWMCGFAAMAWCWLISWRRMRAEVRAATACKIGLALDGIRILQSESLMEPCVFGILRPVILLPPGIQELLTREQLSAIVMHEVCHARRRDNLIAALHMLPECLFWFFPPVHAVGRQLMQERENACDEAVLRTFGNRETYAQSILAVCRLGIAAAPACAAGVGVAGLKRRIEAIMRHRASAHVTWRVRVALALAAFAAVAGPVVTGALFVRPVDAQSHGGATAPQPFAVASIKPNHTGARNSGFRRFVGGNLDAVNITLKGLIAFAYDIPQERVLQGPSWMDGERYDILAKPEPGGDARADAAMNTIRLRTQALLAERFHLAMHKDTRQLPIFRLLVDNGGPKHLQTPKGDKADLFTNGHHVTCQAASMEFFAKNFLAGQVGGPVIDQTGIKGAFDFTLDWAADDLSGRPSTDAGAAAPDSAGPSFFSALREQLGLKLEAGKGPVEVLIVDHAEKATEN